MILIVAGTRTIHLQTCGSMILFLNVYPWGNGIQFELHLFFIHPFQKTTETKAGRASSEGPRHERRPGQVVSTVLNSEGLTKIVCRF